MPFNELPRRDSWPPTVIHLPSPTDPDDLSNIDSNPISFFLTTPTYDQELDLDFPSPEYDDIEDLSAGIEGSPESKSLPAIREVSPSSLQRSRLESLLPGSEDEGDMDGIWDVDMDMDIDDDIDMEEASFGMGMPISLKDFTDRHNQLLSNSHPSQRASRSRNTSTNQPHKTRGLGISLPIPDPNLPKRGRAKVRLAPGTGRGRGRARTLSARRPQSWRVPSPDIYSIEEEREENTDPVVRRLRAEDHRALSTSAPVVSCMVRPGAEGGEKKKVQKRVHWAF